MCNYFNSYYTSVVSQLTVNFPQHINFQYLNSLPTVFQSCMLFPTSFLEIFEILSSFKNKGNTIFDIKPDLLIKIHEYIIPVLVNVYNRCINVGIYPSKLKVARVIPIFKSSD